MNPVAPVTSAIDGSMLRTVSPMDVSVYFNPKCSNCRTVQSILQEKGVEASYVRYLEQAPTREDLEQVLKRLGTDDPREIVRTKEPEYRELGLARASREELLDAMVAHPILIQRPIVIAGDKAIVARPGERVLELFE
jgi:arsenate reductase